MRHLTNFVYAPLRLKGELIKRYDDEIDLEPRADMVIGNQEATPKHKEWKDDHYGRTTRLTERGLELKTEGRYLYKLHDVTVVQSPPGGAPLWYIVLEPGICGIEACPWRARYVAGKDPQSHTGPIIDMGPQGKLYLNLMPKVPVGLHIKDPRVFHAHSWEDNYYHRVLDSLPRVWAEEAGLIPPGTPRENRAHLAVHYDTLYFPSFWPASGFNPRPIKWLRSKFKKHPPQEKRTAFFLSRSDANKRRALNEDAIVTTLGKMGLAVTRACGSQLSFQQQIELAERSQLIIGPHGAGITNAIFGSAAGVIEFLPTSHAHPVYQYLAKWSANWYGRILCPGPKDCDMTVDLDKLEAMVKEAMKATA